MDTIHLLNIFSGITVCSVEFVAAIYLILSILLLICSALISGAEVAFFSFTPEALNEMGSSDKKSDLKILNALKKPQKLQATILISNCFVNIAIILLFTRFITTVVNFENTPSAIGISFHVIVTAFILLLFGEIMPKVYATQNGEKTATKTVGLLTVLGKIFRPLVKLLVNSTSVINKRLEKHNHTNISIDDLSQALELTSQNSDEDTEILEGIIKFGNIQVSDIMTPRVDIIDVNIKSGFKDLLATIANSGYSRIPVYSENRDSIRGLVYSKDLLPHLDKPENFRWQNLIRQAYYVPETKKIDDLLNEFQGNRIHLALVVDEYGGTSGLITLEDILEEIVGDISDEYDSEERLYTKIDEHTFIFKAKILLNDLYKMAEIDKEDFVKVTEEVETLAGLILELKGEIPMIGERIEYDRYIFEITAVDDRRIKEIKLHIEDKKETETQEDDNE